MSNCAEHTIESLNELLEALANSGVMLDEELQQWDEIINEYNNRDENQLKLAYEDEATYTKHYDDEDTSAMFHDVSYALAFDDCVPLADYTIIYHGREVIYKGWAPGMKYTYVYKDKPDEVVFSRSYEEWDH